MCSCSSSRADVGILLSHIWRNAHGTRVLGFEAQGALDRSWEAMLGVEGLRQ